MLPLEGTLLEKLRKIEALHAGTNVSGEREAARRAAERIRARLAELRGREEDIELHYSLKDPWKRKLFVALCRRYNLKPFREAGRRYSTVQVRAPKAFHDRTPMARVPRARRRARCSPRRADDAGDPRVHQRRRE
jgi:hypothetical protein